MGKIGYFLAATAGAWLLGTPLVLLTQNKLNTASKELLKSAKPDGIFSDVTVQFAGQQATLTGTVPTDTDRTRAEDLIKNHVRKSTLFGGGGLNPVTKVTNELTTDAKAAAKYSSPWALATIPAAGAITLYGNVGSQSEADGLSKAAQAEAEKRGTTLENKLTVDAKVRPGTNLDGSIKEASVISSVTKDAAAYAFTSVDGRWYQRPGTSTALEVSGAWPVPAPTSVDIAPAVAQLRATLPKSTGWLALADASSKLIVAGEVPSEDVKTQIATKLVQSYPGKLLDNRMKISDLTTGDTTTGPTFNDLPKVADNGWAASAKLGGAWTIETDSADVAKAKETLKANLPENYDPASLILAWNSAQEAAKAKAMASPERSARWGWAIADKEAWLFGQVPDADAKKRLGESFAKDYPDLKLNDTVELTSSLFMPDASAPIAFPKPPDATKKAWAGFGGRNIAAKLYEPDVYDSEILADFPAVRLNESQIGRWFAPWRTKLTESGTLKKESPYLSVFNDGKTITAVGEVSNEADKTAVMEALKKAAGTLPVADQLSVSSFVNNWDGLSAELGKLPADLGKAEANTIALRPGSSWRNGVIHSIYFSTGDAKKSKDQERALSQVRRIFASMPSARFEVSGHTDNVGDKAANQKLSEERANNFKEYLTKNGVIPDFVTSRGAGPDEPIADNGTDAGKALNRRVDITLKK